MSLVSTCPLCHAPSEILLQGHRCATPRCANYDAKVEVPRAPRQEMEFKATAYPSSTLRINGELVTPEISDNDTIPHAELGSKTLELHVHQETVGTIDNCKIDSSPNEGDVEGKHGFRIWALAKWVTPGAHIVENKGYTERDQRFRDLNARVNFGYSEERKKWIVPVCEKSLWVYLNHLTVRHRNDHLTTKEECSELMIRKYFESECVICRAKEGQIHTCSFPHARQRLGWTMADSNELHDRLINAGFKRG